MGYPTFCYQKAIRGRYQLRKHEIRNMLEKGATLAKSTDSTIHAQKITVLLSTACHRNISPFLQQSLK